MPDTSDGSIEAPSAQSATVTPSDAPGGPGGLEALQDLKLDLQAMPQPQQKTKGRKRQEAPQPPPGPSIEEQKSEAAKIARMLIEQINGFLSSRGMTPLNGLQAMLIETGFVGCMIKYNLKPDIDKYPELMLAGGMIWVGYEKYEEYKKIVGSVEQKEAA